MRRVLECFNPAAKNMNGRSVRNAEEINDYDHFILGHITSTAILDSISEKGLLPPRVTNIRIKDNLDSDINGVYLLCRMDKSYVRRAIKEFGGESLIVVTRVATHKLLPDENALFAFQKEDTLLNQLYCSLCFGQCKHEGPIEVEQILGFYNEEGQQLFPRNDKIKSI